MNPPQKTDQDGYPGFDDLELELSVQFAEAGHSYLFARQLAMGIRMDLENPHAAVHHRDGDRMSAMEGTWAPSCGAYTAVLPKITGEEQLIIDGPSSEGYRVVQAPRSIRMPGHMVREAFGNAAAPGLVVVIPCDNMTVKYLLGEHREGRPPCPGGCTGHDWWEAQRWP